MIDPINSIIDPMNKHEKMPAPSNDDDCAKKIEYLDVCAEYWKVYSDPDKSREWKINLRDWPDAGKAAFDAIPCFDEYEEEATKYYLSLRKTLGENYRANAIIWAAHATKSVTVDFLMVKGGNVASIPVFNKLIHTILVRTTLGNRYWNQAIKDINEKLPVDLHMDPEQVSYVSYVALSIVSFFKYPFQELPSVIQKNVVSDWEKTYEEPFPFDVTETA